ncbi:alpha-amylase (plasmid) [Fulvitalea axinellae]|uniref:Alpha-amylase n=1 Tax=Fulvitalea axinellae TaxID=1182444 RepID=A0AAU9DIT7_9BACT|nr:alpha-amylase [Fulvitalea axinellae]
MRKVAISASLLAALAMGACGSSDKETKTEEISKITTASRVKPDQKVVVYQMMTRLFGNQTTTNKKYGTIEENGIGKFNDITPKALEELKKLGVTDVWYTGVLEHAQMEDFTAHGISLDDPDVVKGRAGSPYAIKDYYDVDPALATDIDKRMEEFEALVKRTHDLGLNVWIDFIPNHVARNYVSDAKPEGVEDFGASDDKSGKFSAQNNFYYFPGETLVVPAENNPLGDLSFKGEDNKFDETPAKATGNDVFTSKPSIHDWFETIKLNYGVDYQNGRTKHFEQTPDTWNKMRDILAYWAGKGVDGFRCDMAEMVPVEFWGWVIPQIQKINPDIKFTAEIYNPKEYYNYINKGKFDYLYDKVDLYDTLKHVMQGHGSTDNLPEISERLSNVAPHMLRFLENHDEQRIATGEFAGDAELGRPALVVSSLLQKGPMMVYFGQEVGEPGAGDEGFGGEDGRSTIFDYWGVPNHQRWMNGGKFDGGQLTEAEKALRSYYAKVLNVTRSESVFAKGDLKLIHALNREADPKGYTNKMYTFVRQDDKDQVVVFANFSKDQKFDGQIVLPKELAKDGAYLDLLTGKEYGMKDGKIAVKADGLQSLVLKRK